MHANRYATSPAPEQQLEFRAFRAFLADDDLQLVACPQCGNPADATTHATVASTHGPVKIVRVSCLDRHWYLMPADQLIDLTATRPTRVTGRTG